MNAFTRAGTTAYAFMLLSAWASAAPVGPGVSEWLNAANGNWTTAANWSTNPFYPNNGTPGASDQYSVYIEKTGAPYAVTLANSVEVSNVTLDSPDATLAITGSLTTNSLYVTRGLFTVGAAQSSGYRLNVNDDIVLNNTSINILAGQFSGQSAEIYFRDTVSPQFIAGPGTVTFVQGGSNRIFPGKELTIGPNVVVASSNGTGEFRNGRLVNEGTIRSGTGSTLDVSVSDFVNKGILEVAGSTTIGNNESANWENDGTIRIKPGGRLSLTGIFTRDDLGTIIDEGAALVLLEGILDNTGRTLDLTGLELTIPLRLDGGEIRGGVITSSGSGKLELDSGRFGILNGVTLATNVTIEGGAPGADVAASNGLILDHCTLTMLEGASLRFDNATQLIGGTGTIFAPNLPNTAAITAIAGENLIIGESITIRNGTEGFRELQIAFKENRGTIIAEAPNTVVTIGKTNAISIDEFWDNNGTIRLLNGTLDFWGDYTVDDIGTIERSGGEVVLNGKVRNQSKVIRLNATTGLWKFRAHVTGGRVESTDGITADLAGIFENVTLAGPAIVGNVTGYLTVRSELNLDNASILIPSGRAISIASTPVTINGTGDLVLNGTLNETLIQTSTNTVLTIGPGVTIRTGASGGGTVGRLTHPVINQGKISAESMDKVLLVGGTLSNTGVLQAKNNSLLRLDTATWTNQGQMNVDGARILVTGTSFTNGENGSITGKGDFELTNSQLVNRGVLAPGLPGGLLNVKGSLNLQSPGRVLIEIGSTSVNEFDSINVTLNAIINGQLQVSLMNGSHLAPNKIFPILNVTGSATGKFVGFDEGARVATLDGFDVFITYAAGSGNDIALFTIPEPTAASCALIATFVCLSTLGRTLRQRSH